MIDPLIGVTELVERSSSVALADVRWYLGEPGEGRRQYERGHIPGAVYVDLERDLSASEGPGRHPLPNRAEFATRIGQLGFGTDDLIVAYDDRGGAVAARLWWMLRDIGHDDVRVLNGGIPAWLAAGHDTEVGMTNRPPSTMTVRPSLTRQLDRSDVRAGLGTMTLLDARAPERYRGDEEPIDPVAGHIPTAVSAPMTENLDHDETFRDAAVLRQRFLDAGVDVSRDTVVYCGSGVTACHNALAMVRAGLPEPMLYPGSWSDWSTAGESVGIGNEPGDIPN